MIPRHLSMCGFMCYREEAKIDFKGSSLWALCGDNGAGKSAVFDAMRYALYGEHRLGKQNVEELIHRGADSLLVEFDFTIGENEYRVKRTYSRKKKSTALALHLKGPDAPASGQVGPRAIEGTENSTGLKRWVINTLGLDHDAFTVSVLLLQGKSDVLLHLEDAERHAVLSRIIDLSRYDRLCERAREKGKDHTASAKNYKVQLDGLEIIDEKQILHLENQIKETRIKKDAARHDQLVLAGLKVQAEHWTRLQAEEQRLHKALTHWNDLLVHAESIEQRAGRLNILQTVMPSLTKIHCKQEEWNGFKRQMLSANEELSNLDTTLLRLSSLVSTAQTCLQDLKRQHQEKEEEYKTTQKRLLALQLPCNEIKRLHGKKQACQKFVDSISVYDPTLEQQQQQVREQLAQLEQIAKALPNLERLATAQASWQQAELDLSRIHQQLRTRQTNYDAFVIQMQEMRNRKDSLDRALITLRSEVASKKTLWDESKKRLARFQHVDGQATCSYCGQRLTAEHLTIERQRIEQELQTVVCAYDASQQQLSEQEQQRKKLEQEIEKVARNADNCQKSMQQLTKEQDTSAHKQTAALAQVEAVLQTVAPEYIHCIQGTAIQPPDPQLCIQAAYPTQQDLHALALQLQDQEPLTQRLQTNERAIAQRAQLIRQHDTLLDEIQQLEHAYPPEQATALLQEFEQANHRYGALDEELKAGSLAIEKQDEQVVMLISEEQDARKKKSWLEQELAVAQAQAQQTQQTIEELQRTLPTAWQVQAQQLSEWVLADCQQEINTLQGATEQLQQLTEARQHHARYQEDLNALEVEKQSIPEKARCLADHIQQQIDQLAITYQDLEEREQKAKTESLHLKSILDRREEIQQKLSEAKRLASRYKTLADLFGREGLQHYLLQKAEKGILYHANETLDTISGGMLRLDVRPDTEGKTTVLNMVAYNTAISASDAQSLKSLSGSQQFRVSVSLALGIGRYIGRDSHRVESLIIDEGFGSLDTKGRAEMIHAIRELADTLKCIIVVSHQHEFFDEFPNKYLVELIDGGTQVSLL